MSPQRLSEIEKEFNEKIAQGWFAADISKKRDVLIREFDPNAEILLIPRSRRRPVDHMSARLVQDGPALRTLVTFSNPIQDKSANDKARQLLRSILPENTW